MLQYLAQNPESKWRFGIQIAVYSCSFFLFFYGSYFQLALPPAIGLLALGGHMLFDGIWAVLSGVASSRSGYVSKNESPDCYSVVLIAHFLLGVGAVTVSIYLILQLISGVEFPKE